MITQPLFALTCENALILFVFFIASKAAICKAMTSSFLLQPDAHTT